MSRLLEIAAFNLEAAVIAAHAGADRIELCIDYAQGGLTPPRELITVAVKELDCPVFVMIRPRPGNFIYTEEEVRQMKQALITAKECGAHGLVFGALREDGCVDEATNSALVALAAPLPCTFHRAFDRLPDKINGLETLIGCGFRRVLTSGGAGGADANIMDLKKLVALAMDRIIVMPGGGIRPENLQMIMLETEAVEYHSAAILDNGVLPDMKAIVEMKQLLREMV